MLYTVPNGWVLVDCERRDTAMIATKMMQHGTVPCCSLSKNVSSFRGRPNRVSMPMSVSMSVSASASAAASSPAPHHTVALRFRITQRLEYGKRLCVVGSPKELGVWNANQSTCSLSWTEGDVWVGELAIAPGPVEFKLVQVSEEEVVWPSGNNVSLLIPDQASGVDVTGEGEGLNLTILGGGSVEENEGMGEKMEVEVEEEEEAEKGVPASASGVVFETLEIGRLEDMKVADLKKLLKERGLPVSGKKAELIERLSS